MMLTIKEVAARLRVSPTCVYQLVECGKLACHRIGARRGSIRITPDDLDAFINGCRIEGNLGAAKPRRSRQLKHLKQ